MEVFQPRAALSGPEPGLESEEARLVAAILRKDRKAAAEFVERYTDEVYSYLERRLLPRLELLEDLLQEVFMAALENLPRLRDPNLLRSWLLGIARHKVEDHYRSRLREPEPLEGEESASGSIPATEPAVDEMMDRNRLLAQARRVLKSLPEHYSTVLLWRYWEKRSTLEMAQQTGKSVKAIERLLARARQEFKRRWNDEPLPF